MCACSVECVNVITCLELLQTKSVTSEQEDLGTPTDVF